MKAKKVFCRIWRTMIIVVDSFWNLCSLIVALGILLGGMSSYTIEEVFTKWVCGTIVIVFVNLLDFVIRKNFINY